MKLNNIYTKIRSKKGQIAVLIDPEKTNALEQIKPLVEKAEFAKIDYFFVGGSSVARKDFKNATTILKSLTCIPIVIFPGDFQQLSTDADAILYLSLLSGRNPEYLIGQHVRYAQDVFHSGIEVIPTAYILIDGGKQTSVASVSQTIPIMKENLSIALNTTVAGYLQGKKAVYFDAGSGALNTVNSKLIKQVSAQLDMAIIVGGGVKTVEQISQFQQAGANVIVIGNKIEEDIDFLLDIKAYCTVKQN